MSTAIVYYSKHHGNTKKLLDAIAAYDGAVTLIDVAKNAETDLSEFDRICFASGIYFSRFAEQVISFAGAHLPEGKDIFYIYTHGAPGGDFLKEMRNIADEKRCREIGVYHCRGYDTFGPFKLVGGIAKRHPSDSEIAGAVEFYKSL